MYSATILQRVCLLAGRKQICWFPWLTDAKEVGEMKPERAVAHFPSC